MSNADELHRAHQTNVAAAIMKAVVEAQATRHVASAVAAALMRSANATCSTSQDEKEGFAEVSVPDSVASGIPVVAASLAAQQVAGVVAGKTFHNAGDAEKAMRKVLPPDLVKDFRNVRRARNAVVHGATRGANVSAPDVDRTQCGLNKRCNSGSNVSKDGKVSSMLSKLGALLQDDPALSTCDSVDQGIRARLNAAYVETDSLRNEPVNSACFDSTELVDTGATSAESLCTPRGHVDQLDSPKMCWADECPIDCDIFFDDTLEKDTGNDGIAHAKRPLEQKTNKTFLEAWLALTKVKTVSEVEKLQEELTSCVDKLEGPAKAHTKKLVDNRISSLRLSLGNRAGSLEPLLA